MKTMWEKFLDKHFCSADEQTENRPCDNGKYCDACRSPEADRAFKEFQIEVEGKKSNLKIRN